MRIRIEYVCCCSVLQSVAECCSVLQSVAEKSIKVCTTEGLTDKLKDWIKKIKLYDQDPDIWGGFGK